MGTARREPRRGGHSASTTLQCQEQIFESVGAKHSDSTETAFRLSTRRTSNKDHNGCRQLGYPRRPRIRYVLQLSQNLYFTHWAFRHL